MWDAELSLEIEIKQGEFRITKNLQKIKYQHVKVLNYIQYSKSIQFRGRIRQKLASYRYHQSKRKVINLNQLYTYI